MALDHSRTFLHEDYFRFYPEDLSQTTPALFFTRWVTHYCAPVFIFLTGTSSFLFEQKTGSKKKLFNFLISRGLILILLELTLFRACWLRFDHIFEPFIGVVVIWAIGISMIFLAFLMFLPNRVILVFGLLVVFFHNLLSGISFPEGSNMAIVWAFLYKGGGGMLFGKIYINFLYPVIPYLGLIALGYCIGYIYTPSFTIQRRRNILISAGAVAILLFLVLRYFNLYGDPSPWEARESAMYSVMAFLRTTKYPVSLLYILMTIGPSLIILALIEPVRNRVVDFFRIIGSVPMFYYILHLVFFSLLGAIVGYNKDNLVIVYGWFVILVLLLFILCRWYANYKFRHPDKRWLKYL